MNILIGKASLSLVKFLNKPQKANVLLVTSKGIYLEVNQRILILCQEMWGQIPIGISLNFLPVLHQNHSITIGGGILESSGVCMVLNLTAFPNSFSDRLSYSDWEQGAISLINTGKYMGLVPLAWPLLMNQRADQWNQFCQMGFPAISSLLNGLRKNDIPMIHSSTRKLMGLGVGLTPSGDDMLCGLMYALLRSPFRDSPGVSALTGIIRSEAPNYTNTISAAYLTAIANNEEFQRMALATLGNWEPLTEIGSNSGCEMLLGILLAKKWIQEEKGVIS